TTEIPIVFNSNDDPVKLGLVASLNHPGGNVTGVSLLGTTGVIGKRMEILHQLVPGAVLYGHLINAKSPNPQGDTNDARAAANAIGQEIVVVNVSPEHDLEAAFADLAAQKVGALLVQSDPLFDNQRERVVGLAARSGIPAMYGRREMAAAGGLISYGSNLA